MKHLYSNIIIVFAALLILLFAWPDTSFAQKRKVMNRPYIDQRPFHYGFLAGMQLQDLELTQNGFTDADGNQWWADAPNYEPGFCVGILGEMRLNEHLALRVIPTMHFGTKRIKYYNLLPTVSESGSMMHEVQWQSMKSTYFTIPVDVKFSAQRFNNYRPYMMMGLSPALDLTIKKGQQLRLNSFDCYVEAGLGCDFYAPWFKFIPEIKFCYGLCNIINKKRNDLADSKDLIFTNSVDGGHSKMIVLTFYFE